MNLIVFWGMVVRGVILKVDDWKGACRPLVPHRVSVDDVTARLGCRHPGIDYVLHIFRALY